MKPLQMFLLAADKLIRCRWDGRSDQLEIANTALEGETLREVAQDPTNPQRLYAATLTEIHVSEDGGDSWKWLPAGGIDFRDIWAMQVHPTRANELYVGTLPAVVMSVKTAAARFASCPHSANCRITTSGPFRRRHTQRTFAASPWTVVCQTKSSSASRRAG